MTRRRDIWVSVAIAGVAVALLAWAVPRLRRGAEVHPDAEGAGHGGPPLQSPTTDRSIAAPDDAYRAILSEVNPLLDEGKFPEARALLLSFSSAHPNTREAALASRNAEQLARMQEETDDRVRQDALAAVEGEVSLLEASGEFDRALATLEAVPQASRGDEWDARRALVVQRAKEARRTPEPEPPKEHPERAALAKQADEAESLWKEGDRARARDVAQRLHDRLAVLDVPSLTEEFGPRADSLLEQAELALAKERTAQARFLEDLPRLPALRKEMKRRLNAARREALGAIFDRKLYPDEGHGVAGQPAVDEKVRAVRRIWERPVEAAGDFDSTVAEALKAMRGPRGDTLPDKLLAGVAQKLSPKGLALDAEEQGLLDTNARVRAFDAGAKTSMSAMERQVLDLLNDYREMMGLRALEVEEHLVMAARWHSKDMRDKQYFDHFDLEGRGPLERTAEMQYQRAPVGENIITGTDDAPGVHWGFYYSSGHHRNMLLRLWTHIGIARAGTMWTEDFGAGQPQSK